MKLGQIWVGGWGIQHWEHQLSIYLIPLTFSVMSDFEVIQWNFTLIGL